MTSPFDIKDFAHRFACHLFDEALLKSHDDKCVVEAKLQRFLAAEISANKMRGSRPVTRRKGKV